jgi:hypothetical protein
MIVITYQLGRIEMKKLCPRFDMCRFEKNFDQYTIFKSPLAVRYISPATKPPASAAALFAKTGNPGFLIAPEVALCME